MAGGTSGQGRLRDPDAQLGRDSPADSSVRVLVADDSDIYRGAVRDVIAATPRFSVVGEAGCVEDAIEMTARARPDLVFVDVRMPGPGGLAVAEWISENQPDARVVMMTADSDESSVEQPRFPTVDKRSLSPQLVVDLWHNGA